MLDAAEERALGVELFLPDSRKLDAATVVVHGTDHALGGPVISQELRSVLVVLLLGILALPNRASAADERWWLVWKESTDFW